MAEQQRTANDTVASTAGDFFCDLCKLEFSAKEVTKKMRYLRYMLKSII
jgi:hypothetical protein